MRTSTIGDGCWLASRARLELLDGNWNAATGSAISVLRDSASQAAPRAWALATLGVIRTRRGDPGSHEALDQARDAVRSTGQLDQLAAVAAARAEAAWLDGDDAAVVTETDDVLKLAVALNADWIAGELAHLRSRAGIRQILAPDAIAHPYRLSIDGDCSEAARVWTRIGCPYESALALAASDDESARRHAIDQLKHLGARRTAAIITTRERAVRGPCRQPRRTTRQNSAGLTARELQVLRLVATGLRNTEIAQHLVLSVAVGTALRSGRDIRPHRLGLPPARIPACGITALGSCLGWWRRIAARARDAGSWAVVAIDQRGATSAPRSIWRAGCDAVASTTSSG